MQVAFEKNFFFFLPKEFSILNMECSVGINPIEQKHSLLLSLSLVDVYEETNTIWFSENVPEEETMYKLIGVSRAIVSE